MILPPEIKFMANFFELGSDKAKKINFRSLQKVTPGYFYTLRKATENERGYSQKEIILQTLWLNAKNSYLGVKYYEWPLALKEMARTRILSWQKDFAKCSPDITPCFASRAELFTIRYYMPHYSDPLGLLLQAA